MRSISFASQPYQITRVFQTNVAAENLVRIFLELLCLRFLGHISELGDVSLAGEGVDACGSQRGRGEQRQPKQDFHMGCQWRSCMSCAALESSAAGARRSFGAFAVDFMWKSVDLR